MEQQINLNKIIAKLNNIENSMVTRDELFSFFETLEILNNPETMRKIYLSEKDIKSGNVKEINSLSDLDNWK